MQSGDDDGNDQAHHYYYQLLKRKAEKKISLFFLFSYFEEQLRCLRILFRSAGVQTRPCSALHLFRPNGQFQFTQVQGNRSGVN